MIRVFEDVLMGRIYSRCSRKRWRVKTRGLGIIDVDATDTSENHDRDYHCIDVDVETRVSPGFAPGDAWRGGGRARRECEWTEFAIAITWEWFENTD